MGHKRWADIKKGKLSPEQEREVDEAVRRESVSITLRELREAAGKTQVETAKIAEITQAELSRFEARDDRKISTLRRFVEALGGRLEITAVMNGKRVLLEA